MFVSVASPGKEGALDERGADTTVCKRKKTKETEKYRKLYRFGRHPGEQGPRLLSQNHRRVEKLVTGTTIHTITTYSKNKSYSYIKYIRIILSFKIGSMF